jgi:hypothetical protein
MNYACQTFKPFLEAEARRLQELEEARGELLRLFLKDGFCIAIFSWGAVSLPAELAGRLRQFVGDRISVLRFDGEFHIRNLDQEGIDATQRQ